MVKNDSILQQTHNLKSQIDIHPKKKKKFRKAAKTNSFGFGVYSIACTGRISTVYFKEETRQLDCEGDEDQLHI